MKTAVHISADFPDPFGPDKTAAVLNLVDGAGGYRHVVYSLNRVDGLFGINGFQFGEDRVCLIYRAPPKGLLLRTRLDAIAEWILADLAERRIRPDVIHAHKFTIEGLIALHLRKALECPVICNIQGDTDTQIAEIRYDLRRVYRELGQECSKVLSFAPWSGPAIERILGTQLRCEVLPVGTTCDRLLKPANSAGPQLVSLFHLDSWRRKGAEVLASAMVAVAEDRPDVVLDIYGGGSERQRRALLSAIQRRGAGDLVRLRGPLKRDEVQSTLNRYGAFAMPSVGESYGMAFVESLFSGTPVVFPRGRAIDGLLPESDIGASCEPCDVADLARAINYVLDNETVLKNRLGSLQEAGALDHLRLASITNRYREILEAIAA